MEIKRAVIKESALPAEHSRKKDFIEWDANEGRSNRLKDYRRYANIDEDFEITESNIDDYALNRVSCEHVCDRNTLLDELLGRN